MGSDTSPRPSADFGQQITWVYTYDLAATARFYTDTLGLPMVLDQGNCRVFQATRASFIGLCQRPDRDVEPIQKLYFAAIATARERVYVTTPYFVPDDAILTALTTAGMRGVDVRVLVPRRSDSLVVTAAARSYYDALLAAGVRVYEYQPTMIHSKTVVVDDFFAAVGTANMDNRSFRLNFEVSAIVYGAENAEVLSTQFRKDLAASKEITTAKRLVIPLRWRIAEAGARILSPLL